MPHRMRWKLATTRDLVAFHATRSDVYQVISDLVRAPLTRTQAERMLPALARVLARHPEFPALEALRTAVARGPGDPGAPAAGCEPPDACDRCGSPADSARITLIRTAGLISDRGRHAELRAMAILAGRTGHALARAAFVEAATLSAVQSDYLRGHGGVCLQGLVEALAACDAPMFMAASEVLGAVLTGDLEDLESEPKGSS